MLHRRAMLLARRAVRAASSDGSGPRLLRAAPRRLAAAARPAAAAGPSRRYMADEAMRYAWTTYLATGRGSEKLFTAIDVDGDDFVTSNDVEFFIKSVGMVNGDKCPFIKEEAWAWLVTPRGRRTHGPLPGPLPAPHRRRAQATRRGWSAQRVAGCFL